MKEIQTPLDHSYVYTDDKIFFSVCGNLHSKESIFGMPYYFPTKELEEIMDIQINEFNFIRGEKYTKLLSQIDRESYPNFIKDNYPDYFYSPPMWEILMKVDRTKIRTAIDPKSRVHQILDHMTRQYSDENPILYTLKQMQKYDPRILKNLGISGSGLLRDDFLSAGSDLDLVFYKRSAVSSAKEFSIAMRQIDSRFTGLEGENLAKYVQQKARQLGGTNESVYRLVKNRWDILYVDGVKLDFSFVDGTVVPPLLAYETQQSPEPVKIRAKIVDVENSYYTPTVLGIDNPELGKVVITKRGYICLFERDHVVEITGMRYKTDEAKTDIILVDEYNGGNIAPL